MIHGIGIDIVNIPKFKKAIEKWGDKLKGRVFTHGELSYCECRRFSEQHLAVRFAAKEAFIKAIGSRVRFKEIDIMNNSDGRPYMVLNPQFPIPNSEILTPNSEFRTHLSLSHDGDYCIAQVIVEVKIPRLQGMIS